MAEARMNRYIRIIDRARFEIALAALTFLTVHSHFWRFYCVGTILLVALGHYLIRAKPTRDLRLDRQHRGLNFKEPVHLSADHLYEAAVDLTIHSDAMSWQRLYTLLTANSITMLAWATIFSSGTVLSDSTKGRVGFFIALPGLILSTGPYLVQGTADYTDSGAIFTPILR